MRNRKCTQLTPKMVSCLSAFVAFHVLFCSLIVVVAMHPSSAFSLRTMNLWLFEIHLSEIRVQSIGDHTFQWSSRMSHHYLSSHLYAASLPSFKCNSTMNNIEYIILNTPAQWVFRWGHEIRCCFLFSWGILMDKNTQIIVNVGGIFISVDCFDALDLIKEIKTFHLSIVQCLNAILFWLCVVRTPHEYISDVLILDSWIGKHHRTHTWARSRINNANYRRINSIHTKVIRFIRYANKYIYRAPSRFLLLFIFHVCYSRQIASLVISDVPMLNEFNQLLFFRRLEWADKTATMKQRNTRSNSNSPWSNERITHTQTFSYIIQLIKYFNCNSKLPCSILIISYTSI